MKKITVLLLSLCLYSQVLSATITDNDGILGAAWSTPTTGNLPTSYILSYNINGKADSMQVETTKLKDSSVVLLNRGDWAVLKISSVYEYWSEYLQQNVREQSTAAYSDTALFDQTISVDPPTGIHWE